MSISIGSEICDTRVTSGTRQIHEEISSKWLRHWGQRQLNTLAGKQPAEKIVELAKGRGRTWHGEHNYGAEAARPVAHRSGLHAGLAHVVRCEGHHRQRRQHRGRPRMHNEANLKPRSQRQRYRAGVVCLRGPLTALIMLLLLYRCKQMALKSTPGGHSTSVEVGYRVKGRRKQRRITL